MGSRVQIHSAPPFSPSVVGRLGESIEIRARARDLRLRVDLESGSGGADRGTRQNLSGLDSAGSTDVRSHFAFIDRTEALSDPGGNFNGNTPSQRAARFS
jgi:hypothetical protein